MEYFKTAKGFACVYGEPGSGKTTSLRAFTAQLNPQLFRVIYLPLSTTTVQDFYRHLAIGLGLLPKFRKVDLFHQIQEQIVKAAMQKNLTTFIVIDEAQFIQHAIFHDLRLLFNFQMDSQNYGCVLLIRQPLLLNQLSLQIHQPLKQRSRVNMSFTVHTPHRTVRAQLRHTAPHIIIHHHSISLLWLSLSILFPLVFCLCVQLMSPFQGR